jgi:hypothetical protein
VRPGIEVPGVRCRIVHETFDAAEHGRTVGLACCQSAANVSPEPAPGVSDAQRRALRQKVGFERCPIWEHDKERIAAGEKSMGDALVAEEADARAYREDLTGSQFGDTSFMDEMDRQADETVARIQEHRQTGDDDVLFTEGNWRR